MTYKTTIISNGIWHKIYSLLLKAWDDKYIHLQNEFKKKNRICSKFLDYDIHE